MAIVSSHTLNGVDGTHAGGIRITLTQLGTGKVLFDEQTCLEGRLSELVDLSDAKAHDQYELLCYTGDYWDRLAVSPRENQIMQEVVLRFSMPDSAARYHMPLILNPNSYSCWWSVPE